MSKSALVGRSCKTCAHDAHRLQCEGPTRAKSSFNALEQWVVWGLVSTWSNDLDGWPAGLAAWRFILPRQGDRVAVSATRRIILGSQSPQRLQLLSTVVAQDRIDVVPPTDAQEAGFTGLVQLAAMQQRVLEIALTKGRDVLRQVENEEFGVIISADTVVVAETANGVQALGKPDGPGWQQLVRNWFMNHYRGQTHRVLTGLCLFFPEGVVEQEVVTTEVEFREFETSLLDWYLETGEPLNKAGGYGIQSAGSLFVSSVRGSLSNVIGLPIESLWLRLQHHGLL